MPCIPTQLTVTPTFVNKRMTLVGTIAVHEKVAVTIIGVVDVTIPEAPVLPAGMVLRLTSASGRTEYARFPALETDAWTISGANATCVLNLSTLKLQRAFCGACADATVEALVFLENGTTDNLYASGRQILRNWPQNPNDPVSGAAGLQDEIDVIGVRIDSHQHDGIDGSSPFAHNNLTARDAIGAHPDIEAGVVSANSKAQLALDASATAGGNASTALAAALAAQAVTGVIQDGGAFGSLTAASTLGGVKILLNQISGVLNTWRASV